MEPIYYTNLFPKIVRAAQKYPVVVPYGGSGSSKSHTVAQYLISLIDNYTGLEVGISRKTMPSNKKTSYKLFIDLMQKYGLYNENNHNKSTDLYKHKGNNITFFSCGETEEEMDKIKSFNFNVEWTEEATDTRQSDLREIRRRLRNPKPKPLPGCSIPFTKNHILLTFNPIDANHWLAAKLPNIKGTDGQSIATYIHSTYKDNPYLDQDYTDGLEATIDESPNDYRVYVLGEWGRLEDLIYPNWEEIPSFPSDTMAWAYGLDFGFPSVTSLTKTGVGDGAIYAEEIIYEGNLTNSQLIERLTHVPRGDIYADAASAGSIEEIRRAGWNIYPCVKGDDCTIHRIDLCSRQTIKITSDSDNIMKEIKGYHRKKDRISGDLKDEPAKVNDHAMNAIEFAVEGLVGKYGYATSAPRPLQRLKSVFKGRNPDRRIEIRNGVRVR